MSNPSPAEHNPLAMPWRAPLSADWMDRWKEADGLLKAAQAGGSTDTTTLALLARQIASQQLGMREQLKLDSLARRLLPLTAPLPGLRRMRIGLLGNRTLSFLAKAIPAAGLARGLLAEAVEAPYDHAATFAHGRSTAFDEQKLDAVLVMLDDAAFAQGDTVLDAAGEDRAVGDAAEFLQSLATAIRERTGATPILATLSCTAPAISSVDVAMPGTRQRLVRRINDAIIDGAARRDWLLWDAASLAAQVGQQYWFDPVRFFEAKTPFAVEASALAADHLCRLLAAMAGKSGRALVLDLDNTLWGGVIGDDGLAGIRLGQNSPEGEAFVAFQKFILTLRQRGVVIAICSKNTDAIAREPFVEHPEMALRQEHIAVFQANWQDKATNVAAIAKTLALGEESIVFVDDNPAERARVRQELPLVAVPEMGSDPAHFVERLAQSGVFEHLMLNREDLGRAAGYESNAKRAEIRAKIGNYDDYLTSLGMKMAISPFDAVGRPRIVQLISKSNQFNLTTRRYNDEDVRGLENDPGRFIAWQVRLDDTFGAHGMIAVVIVEKSTEHWTIDAWLQSCRILERGVEETLMNLLMDKARAAGIKEVRGSYLPTPRNEIVADFYSRLGFEEAGRDAGAITYRAAPATWERRKSFIAVTES